MLQSESLGYRRRWYALFIINDCKRSILRIGKQVLKSDKIVGLQCVELGGNIGSVQNHFWHFYLSVQIVCAEFVFLQV